MPFQATDATWRVKLPVACTPDQQDWLTRGGSLTAHLGTLGKVDVRVMRETKTLPWPDEYRALALGPHAPVWIREVILAVGGTPFVYARSATTLAASESAWLAIRQLGTRPLADLLYRDSEVARSVLAGARLTQRHPLYRRLHHATHRHLPAALLARRSVFVRHGAALLVAECMLPALWRQLAQRR